MLERNGQWLRNTSGKSLLIEGHCDERGTLAYNLVSGEKRVLSARRYLESLGIASFRLHTTSYGEVKPSARSTTKAAGNTIVARISSCKRFRTGKYGETIQ